MSARYARIDEAGVVANLELWPEGEQPAELVAAGDEVRIGWTWDGEAFSSPPVDLADLKIAVLAAINNACDAVLDTLKTTYPIGEVQSWDQQVAEANAYVADPDAAAPMVRAIANARGLPVGELVARIIANSSAWAGLAGNVIGQRQALEDQLYAAENEAAVKAIEIVINVPE